MIKKILILLFLLLITAYLIVAVTAFNTKPADQVCKGMELIIKDSICLLYTSPSPRDRG